MIGDPYRWTALSGVKERGWTTYGLDWKGITCICAEVDTLY